MRVNRLRLQHATNVVLKNALKPHLVSKALDYIQTGKPVLRSRRKGYNYIINDHHCTNRVCDCAAYGHNMLCYHRYVAAIMDTYYIIKESEA
jgi:hypothetical protein